MSDEARARAGEGRIATLAGGPRVVLPDDMETMTTYVVEEQGDWFEVELPFVRALLSPGDRVVDIGANFGVYALSMAARVGSAGHVLAFEPTSATAALLRRSIELNGFSWLRLEQAALADAEGEAELSIGASPELNQLGSGSGKSERVKVTTLARYEDELRGVRFLKLDAEGAEQRILEASGPILEREDPLIMFELRHGKNVNTDLIGAFERRGFWIYSLVRGLSALARFDPWSIDRYLLNLFAAKPTMADKLAAEGFLVRGAARGVTLDRSFAQEYWSRASHRALVRGRDVPASIAWYAMAKGHPDLEVRSFALGRALDAARGDVEKRPTLPRRLTLLRVAFEAGARAVAVDQAASALRELDPNVEQVDAPFCRRSPVMTTSRRGVALVLSSRRSSWRPSRSSERIRGSLRARTMWASWRRSRVMASLTPRWLVASKWRSGGSVSTREGSSSDTALYSSASPALHWASCCDLPSPPLGPCCALSLPRSLGSLASSPGLDVATPRRPSTGSYRPPEARRHPGAAAAAEEAARIPRAAAAAAAAGPRWIAPASPATRARSIKRSCQTAKPASIASTSRPGTRRRRRRCSSSIFMAILSRTMISRR